MGQQDSHEDQQREVPSPAPGKEQPHVPVQVAGWLAGKQLCRKGPDSPGGHLVGRSQQCDLVVKKANSTLGCIRQSSTSRSRGMIFPLNHVETYLGCQVQYWAPQYERVMDILEQVQQSATKMIKGLGHLSYEERLRAGTAQHGEEKAWGILFMCRLMRGVNIIES
ncbi:mitochondrial enolase superfamily member 1 [Grus japonensis]|uniref:Mitochondrial enolase superfamily member 1 n=1 Tax=Grus japonensis TaxID=30415 RepID=A0ABC9W2X7_GRUJA